MFVMNKQTWTFGLPYGNRHRIFRVEVEFSPDWKPTEVMIECAEANAEFKKAVCDGAIILSLVLQRDVPLETLRDAVLRNPDNTPETILGAVVDRLCSLHRQKGQSHGNQNDSH
jgi:hypothetical protein